MASGTLGVNLYNWPREIYRRGFVKTGPGVRCFLYGDVEPFVRGIRAIADFRGEILW
jgi:hypothetical protein